MYQNKKDKQVLPTLVLMTVSRWSLSFLLLLQNLQLPVITARLADPVSHFRFVAARAVDHSRAGNLDHGPSLILTGFRCSTLGYTHVLTPITL